MPSSQASWCRRWDRRPSGPTTPPTCAASRSAAPRKTYSQSRNFALGLALGRGQPRPRDRLAEGEFTAPVLMELAAAENVDMPVSNAVADILRGATTIDDAIESLLTRPFKAEGGNPLTLRIHEFIGAALER